LKFYSPKWTWKIHL